jgi:hypothetical protein
VTFFKRQPHPLQRIPKAANTHFDTALIEQPGPDLLKGLIAELGHVTT